MFFVAVHSVRRTCSLTLDLIDQLTQVFVCFQNLVTCGKRSGRELTNAGELPRSGTGAAHLVAAWFERSYACTNVQNFCQSGHWKSQELLCFQPVNIWEPQIRHQHPLKPPATCSWLLGTLLDFPAENQFLVQIWTYISEFSTSFSCGVFKRKLFHLQEPCEKLLPFSY